MVSDESQFEQLILTLKIELFPPGHYLTNNNEAPVKWYSRDWENFENVKNNSTNIQDLHDALSAAVKRQLMSDVPYGVLLSGGLDSSVTSALAKMFAEKRRPNPSLVSSIAFFCHWFKRLARFGCSTKSCETYWLSSPRNNFYDSRRFRCHTGCNLPLRNLRCYHCKSFYSNVFDGKSHKSNGN